MSFPLAGNENLRESINNMLLSGRLPHAILIEGDPGLGRHTLALYLAKAAVCDDNAPPCGICRQCHLAQVGSHPDISIIAPEDGKKNITVAQIRSLRAQAFVKSHSAKCRVFVIDNADKMNEQSQNALLKVLEEPPEGVVFILIADSRTLLLETVLSRCTVLSLSVPSTQQAVNVLKEKTTASPDEISDALEKTDNNIGKALNIIKKESENALNTAAKEFLQLIFNGNELDALKLLYPFEKDRLAADEFYAALRALCVSELRNSRHEPMKARVLTSLYNDCKEYQELLKTNINLALLFSATVCKAKQNLN